jgi:glutamate transport system substrate-binding protein
MKVASRTLKRVAVVAVTSVSLLLLPSCAGSNQDADQESSNPFPGDSITVGLPDDLPGFGVGTNPATGFDANLARLVTNDLKKPMTPTNLKAAQRDAALLGTGGKKVSMVVSAYSIVQSRLDKGLIFAGVYMKTPQAFLVRTDDGTDWSRETIVEKDVCAVNGTTGSQSNFPEGTNIVERPVMKECVSLLSKNKVDAVFDDEIVLWGYQRESSGIFTVVPIESIGQEQYYGIGLQAQDKDAKQCKKVAEIVEKYVRSTQWRIDFRAYLPAAENAHLADDDDFEATFKPGPDEVGANSCRTQIG